MNDQVHNTDAHRLRNFAAQALEQAGISHEGAEIVADCMVEADLRGRDTHGVVRLAPYIRMIREGNMNPRPRLSVIRETPVSAIIDADNSVGNLASHAAAEMAIGKAKSAGVGMVGVRNSTHNGELAYYPMMALKHDMISLMTTNAPPQIPAYGGISRVLSTNPFAAAVPAGEELPVVLDMATTLVAGGKVRLSGALGKKIPLGWGFDRNGEPTDDPNAVLKEGGFLAWLGGAKGYSLSVFANILAGVLTGGPFNRKTFGDYSSAEYGSQMVREGHFIMVLNIDNFMPVAEFKSRMDDMIRDFRASEPAKGFERVYLPGEPEFKCKSQRLKTGIPISHTVWKQMIEMKEKLGLASFE